MVLLDCHRGGGGVSDSPFSVVRALLPKTSQGDGGVPIGSSTAGRSTQNNARRAGHHPPGRGLLCGGGHRRGRTFLQPPDGPGDSSAADDAHETPESGLPAHAAR